MSNAKDRNYVVTVELLQRLRDAALANAHNLLDESSLLLQHEHYARAYFLAVAAIEEIGKAVQAFDGMGRNLKNSAVSTRLKLQFENHSQKITSAFVPWLLATPNVREEIMAFVDLMGDVKRGREPSMYTDIQSGEGSVVTPEAVVRPLAARHCVRLGYAVLSHATPYVTNPQPAAKTKAQDEMFAMRPSVFHKMTKTEDFWHFYLSRMESGNWAFEIAVTEYHSRYFSKDAKFRTDVVSSDDT